MSIRLAEEAHPWNDMPNMQCGCRKLILLGCTSAIHTIVEKEPIRMPNMQCGCDLLGVLSRIQSILPPDQGQHNCSSQTFNSPRTGPSGPRRSGREADPVVFERITESVQPDDFDLLPGMRRVPSAVASELSRLWTRRSGAIRRDTVSVQPLGEVRESVFGDISDIVEIDLRVRFGISDGSVLARILDGEFPNLRVTQVTILVDDILNDPESVDVMSYTAWCPEGTVPSDLARRQTVDAVVVPMELLGIGRRWVVESIDRL